MNTPERYFEKYLSDKVENLMLTTLKNVLPEKQQKRLSDYQDSQNLGQDEEEKEEEKNDSKSPRNFSNHSKSAHPDDSGKSEIIH